MRTPEMPTVNHSPDFRGDKVFDKEKTPAQQEILLTALRLVQEKMTSLNLPFREPNNKRFVFLNSFNLTKGGEWTHDNYVLIQAENEGNLGTIVHELLHFFSSEFYTHGEEEVEKSKLSGRREVRTGFHGVFYQNSEEKGNWDFQATFRHLNEAITEKMSREIISQDPNLLSTLKPLFAGRKEIRIEQLKKGLELKDSESKNDYEKYIKDLEAIQEASLQESLEQLRSLGISESELKDFEIMSRGEIKEFLNSMRELHKPGMDFYQDVLPRMLDSIEIGYSFEVDRHVYNDEIEILNILLEGMAKVRTKEENISIEEAKKLCWREMQIAYFQNNVMYLRKIDKVWGKGVLRYLNNLSPIRGEEQQVAIQQLREQLITI